MCICYSFSIHRVLYLLLIYFLAGQEVCDSFAQTVLYVHVHVLMTGPVLKAHKKLESFCAYYVLKLIFKCFPTGVFAFISSRQGTRKLDGVPWYLCAEDQTRSDNHLCQVHVCKTFSFHTTTWQHSFPFILFLPSSHVYNSMLGQ